MPAKNLYHDAVKSALIKAGWVIVADPYRIQDKDFDWYGMLNRLQIARSQLEEKDGKS